MSFVEGSYATTEEAIAAVERLQAKGYEQENIQLISNAAVRNDFMEQSTEEVTSENNYQKSSSQAVAEDDRSLWHKIKDAFSKDDYNSAFSKEGPLYNYQDDIANGNIVILIEGEAKTAAVPSEKTSKATDDEQTIQLHEEKLEVEKSEVQTGEVNVSKRVTEEKRTIEVPVEREELVIERHRVNEGKHSDGNMKDEEIVIPISEEQIEVTKQPVVTEEVIIGKETVEETKHVSETVKKEDLDVDTEGDVHVEDKL